MCSVLLLLISQARSRIVSFLSASMDSTSVVDACNSLTRVYNTAMEWSGEQIDEDEDVCIACEGTRDVCQALLSNMTELIRYNLSSHLSTLQVSWSKTNETGICNHIIDLIFSNQHFITATSIRQTTGVHIFP